MKKTYIISLLFSLLCISDSYALTLANIRTEIRRNIRDTDSSRYKYTDTVILDFINEAQRDIVNTTWLLEKTSFYVLTAGVTQYSLPTDLIVVQNIEFLDSSRQTRFLEEVTLKNLEGSNPDWRRLAGEPIQYWVDYSSTSARLQITYIPIPTTASTGTVTVRFTYLAPDLAADGDTPFDSRRHLFPYHMALVYHASMRIKQIERKTDETAFYASLYGNYLAIMMKRINEIPNYTPGMGVATPSNK